MPFNHHIGRWPLAVLALIPFASARAVAQVPTGEEQIAAATLPLPDGMRSDAAVIGWNDSGERADLREGTNGMICIADEPGDERFRVVCYPQALHPLLSRSRELRRQGLEEEERDRRLEEAVEAGEVILPRQPAVLHIVNGPSGSYDPDTGQLGDGASRIQIIFTPYQTAEAMGLPTERQGDIPWVMDSGKLFSHIMIVREGGEKEDGE